MKMLLRIGKLINKVLALIPRKTRAKVKLLVHHKKQLFNDLTLAGSFFVATEYALSLTGFNHFSLLGNLGTPLWILLVIGSTLYCYAGSKIPHFRSAVYRGDINTIALYIESGLDIHSINKDIRNEREIETSRALFWGYEELVGIGKHDSPGDWGAPPPSIIDYDVTRYLYHETPDLTEQFRKVAEEMRILLNFAYEKPKREAIDRALVYSTNQNSPKLLFVSKPNRPGLPKELMNEILLFSSYPKSQNTDLLRQYEIEDALRNPRPRPNNFCTRLMQWFL